jgi:hypothetical protein
MVGFARHAVLGAADKVIAGTRGPASGHQGKKIVKEKRC